MNKYNRHDPAFHINSGILGFQQVKTDKEKVHIWMRDMIERPDYQDRHATTRMANNTSRKSEWIKSVWLKDKVWLHLKKQLKNLDISFKDLEDLADDNKSDKWSTNGDGDRNFLKAVIPNAISEVTGEQFRGQVTQSKGQASESIYNRAFEESKMGEGEYNKLLNKYKNRACVKTYAKTYMEIDNKIIPTRELRKVYMEDKDKRVPVYEDSEVVLGKPHHIFLEYIIPNELPKDIIDEPIIPNKEMNLVQYIKNINETEAQLTLQINEKK